MRKIAIEFDDTPEVRRALTYLSGFARLDEAEFWENEGPDGRPVPEMAAAYEHIADVLDLKLIPGAGDA